MSKIHGLFGKKTWLGCFFVFLVSLGVNALCSLLLIKGVLPDTSASACVYAAWGIGGLIGTCVAVRGKEGALLYSLALFAITFAVIWLLGFGIYGSVNFGGYGIGVAISLLSGCVLGGVFSGSGKQKRHRTTGKRTYKTRHKK